MREQLSGITSNPGAKLDEQPLVQSASLPDQEDDP